MARRALGPAALQVVAAVEAAAAAPILVACSGGADSLALAAAAAVVGRRHNLAVRAVTVDHGLQDGSGQVAARVAAQLHGLGLATEIVAVNVPSTGAGPEADARQARYAALLAAAGQGEEIHLGHTLDDQAETVLLGLARGSGTRSLSGMAPRRDRFVRPLLGLRAALTRQACLEWGLTAWQDPHNADDRFARVRARRRALAVLETELGPGVAEALARSADLARADADLLDALAEQQLATQPGPDLDCAWLGGLQPALSGRVLLAWLRERGAVDVSAVHVAAVGRLVHQWRGQRGVDLPGVRVVRAEGRLQVRGQDDSADR